MPLLFIGPGWPVANRDATAAKSYTFGQVNLERKLYWQNRRFYFGFVASFEIRQGVFCAMLKCFRRSLC